MRQEATQHTKESRSVVPCKSLSQMLKACRGKSLSTRRDISIATHAQDKGSWLVFLSHGTKHGIESC